MMTQPLKIVVKTPMSSKDPVGEQEDGCSLDQENGHLQQSCLNKSCFKSYQLMTQPFKMVVKTLMSSTDPVREQEDGCSLDQEHEHLQRCGLEKSWSKSSMTGPSTKIGPPIKLEHDSQLLLKQPF